MVLKRYLFWGWRGFLDRRRLSTKIKAGSKSVVITQSSWSHQSRSIIVRYAQSLGSVMPRRGFTFFCLPKRNVTKEKGHPGSPVALLNEAFPSCQAVVYLGKANKYRHQHVFRNETAEKRTSCNSVPSPRAHRAEFPALNLRLFHSHRQSGYESWSGHLGTA